MHVTTDTALQKELELLNSTKDRAEIKRRLARPRSRELCRNPLIYVSSYIGLLV